MGSLLQKSPVKETVDLDFEPTNQYMGWLRLVGSSEFQVSFAREPYKRDPYSAKETYKFKKPTNRSHPIVI